MTLNRSQQSVVLRVRSLYFPTQRHLEIQKRQQAKDWQDRAPYWYPRSHSVYQEDIATPTTGYTHAGAPATQCAADQISRSAG